MVLTLDRSEESDRDELAPHDGGPATWRGQLLLAVAGVAALVAGVVHGAAIAAHSEHRAAVWVFLGTAVFQLAWGAAVLVHPRRWLALVGVVASALLLAGWVLAKKRGLTFVDGLDVAEPMRFADGLAASLAATTLLLGGAALLLRRLALPRSLAVVACLALIGVGVPGALAAVDHQHPANSTVDTTAEPASAVPPHPFDPGLPIDLGGVDGVSPQQQARAENLLAATLLGLPQWDDPAYAEAHGFRSIGDGSTGVEHYVNREFMANETILDPNQPESLVFDTTVTPKVLVAAMYMLPPGITLDAVPDIGGALTQWHIHNNLCFTAEDRVAGLTQSDGTCAAPLIKGPEQPMIHVWITPHPCGPFAALEGIGGGQIKEGEQVACDHVHGT